MSLRVAGTRVSLFGGGPWRSVGSRSEAVRTTERDEGGEHGGWWAVLGGQRLRGVGLRLRSDAFRSCPIDRGWFDVCGLMFSCLGARAHQRREGRVQDKG